MIILKQLKLPVTHTEQQFHQKVRQTFRQRFFADDVIDQIHIRRQSLDARKRNKEALFYVYEVGITLKGREEAYLKHLVHMYADRNSDIAYEEPWNEYSFILKAPICKKASKQILQKHPVVVGMGPAGLFCAYLLAKAGLQPIVLERGASIEERTKAVQTFWEGVAGKPMPVCTENNVQFGEGGAGTFSDGKLNTLIKNSKDYQRYVLETLVRHGAPSDILYSSKPHIGTDILQKVVISMREDILANGGIIHFHSRVEELLTDPNRQCMQGLRLADGTELLCKDCILAIGHSARDTFAMLKRIGIPMEKKPFAMGVRVIHPQKLIDENQYGVNEGYSDILPPANYKLTAHTSKGRSVYSFCMCPGGYVVNASSEAEALAINGMSYHARDSKCANSAIVVAITPEDFPTDDVLAGVEFQRQLERSAYRLGDGKIPIQSMGEFLNAKDCPSQPSFEPQIKGLWTKANVCECLPAFMTEALKEALLQYDKKIKGFASDEAWVCAIESRTSSPLRILRDDTMQSTVLGLYPCGEGAGYAGGITSAAVDGIRCAEKIIDKYIASWEK